MRIPERNSHMDRGKMKLGTTTLRSQIWDIENRKIFNKSKFAVGEFSLGLWQNQVTYFGNPKIEKNAIEKG